MTSRHSTSAVTRTPRGLLAALLACAVVAAAGCRGDSISGASQSLTGVVWGAVYAPDGSAVANATVHVEARRASDMVLVSSATAVSNARGEYAASLAMRGFGQVPTWAVVQAHPPSGMAVADGYVSGVALYLDQDGGGTEPYRVDVTLGTAVQLR
jgi:hypothetical protein